MMMTMMVVAVVLEIAVGAHGCSRRGATREPAAVSPPSSSSMFDGWDVCMSANQSPPAPAPAPAAVF